MQGNETRGAGGSKTVPADEDDEYSCVIEGLLPGSAYMVRIQAFNSAGAGPASPSVEFTTLPGVPSAPDAPVISSVSDQAVSLSWREPAVLHGAPVVSYQLQVQDLALGGGFHTLYSGSLSAFDVSGLHPGQGYAFRVKATNSAGASPFSAPAQTTTLAVPPGPPLAVTLMVVVYHSIKLKWSPPAFTGGSDPHAYAVSTRHMLFVPLFVPTFEHTAYAAAPFCFNAHICTGVCI